jgi:selenocysteine-specific elongation factor
MWVIATAGHVDHGKSTLIRALTGMEPDRWAEERRRGLTIGLGFAWTTLVGLGEVAFVDVPGHERFVPTMLAGAGPVPAVLFVVAADGGWMPQSNEHLAALDALGVRHAVLAVTRADLADPGPVLEQARQRIGRTSLGEVEAVAVSGRTGAGLDDLRAAIARMVRAIAPADPWADVRWWIDRSFSVTGAGTVVTGTLTEGTLRVGDELVLASSGERVRVRGLQSLQRATSAVFGVARVAANLRGVDSSAVRHGDALLTPDRWQDTTSVDVVTGADVLPREAVLHIGSAAVAVRVRPLGGCAARLRLARPLPLRVGDRALLRDPGAHRIIAPVDVLDPAPTGLHRRGAARARGAELTALAGARPERIAADFLRRARFLPAEVFRPLGLPVVGEPVGAGQRADPQVWSGLVGRLPEVVAAWSAAHPLAADLPLPVLCGELDLPATGVAERLAEAAGLSVAQGRIVLGSALPARVEAAVTALVTELADAPFAAPDLPRLRELGLGRAELAAAVRAGRLARIAEGIVLLPDACERAHDILATVETPFTVSQARQALRTTRRVAVPLLELLDRMGITESRPDGTRHLRTV